jgi:signal peptidase I
VLGDHRDNSLDSRFWGLVDEHRIMGRVTHVAISFSRQRPWRERFAHALQ